VCTPRPCSTPPRVHTPGVLLLLLLPGTATTHQLLLLLLLLHFRKMRATVV